MSNNQSLLESTREILKPELDESKLRKAIAVANRLLGPEGRRIVKDIGGAAKDSAVDAARSSAVQRASETATQAVDAIADLPDRIRKRLTKKESVMSEYDNTELLDEAGKKKETPTLDTKSEEDPSLYQDAEGGHAKIDTDKGTEGKEGKNKGSVSGKSRGPSSIQSPVASGSSQERLEQHLVALFDGEDLSEGFQHKAATIFEAAINERITEIEENLVEQYQDILSENIESVTNELAEKLDDYLGYVVEQWMEENQIAVDNGIRADVAENFISGLKVLFENCYIDVPDEKYNLLEEVTEIKDEAEENLNKALLENIELHKEILALRCGEVFAEEADGLTDTEVEKLASLTEGIEFEDENQYREKVGVLRESYFKDTPILSEEVETTIQEISEGGPMDRYMHTIQRHQNYNKVS